MRIIFALIFSVFISSLYAISPELAAINTQIQKTQQENKQIEIKVKESVKVLEQTKKRLVRAADKVSNLEAERSGMVRKIADLDKRRIALIQSLEVNKKIISDATSNILFIARNPNFDSENMREYVLTSAIMAGISEQFNEEIKIALEQIKELEKIKETREIEKEKLDRTAKKYASEKKDLDKLMRTRTSLNEKLKTEQVGGKKKLDQLSAKSKSISELSAGVGSSEMSSSASFSRRKLNAPVRGQLVVKFGEKTALGLQSDGWRIRVRGSALVVAPADGVVKFADNFKGFGRIIILSHKNGYNTVLTNLGALDAIVGQEVLAGEPLGRMDSNRPEMYLEVRRGKGVVNPSRLFNEPKR